MTPRSALPGAAPARADLVPGRAPAPVRTRRETLLAGALLLLLGGAVVPLVTGAGGSYSLLLQGLGSLIALLRLAQEPRGVRGAIERVDPVVAALLALLVLSTVWSVDPSLTVRRVAGVLAATVVGLYLAERFPLADQLVLVMRALTVAAVLSALVAVLAPQLGVAAGGWRGVFLTKNVLGRLMTLGVVASLLVLVHLKRQGLPRRGAALCGLVCAAVLLQAGSVFATLILALIVGFSGLTLLVTRMRYPIREATIIGTFTLASVGGVLAWTHRGAVLESLGKSSGLTGRLPLWSSVLPEIKERFWFGHGYGAFWRGWEEPSTSVWLHNPWGPPHAHNGVFELALSVGAVGAGLWLLALLVCLRNAVTLRSRSSVAYWPVALVLLIVAFNVTEVTLMNNALFWALFVAASSSVSARAMRARERLAQVTGGDP